MLRSLILALAFSGAVAQTPAPAPSPGFPNCYICGNSSYTIANPNANVTFPQEAPVSCSSLFYGGLTGFIDPNYCPVIQGFKGLRNCGCSIGAAVPTAPVAPSAPTPAPAPTTYPACNICGQHAFRVWSPEVDLTFGNTSYNCGLLEQSGLLYGQIDPDSCVGLIAVGAPSECNCQLCRDDPVRPIPVDPLGVNKTCLWLVGHYNELIADNPQVIVDPTLFGNQTWGDYLCTDLGQSYTAHDICVATCGNQCNPYCADDETGKTFPTGTKFGNQTCKWLFANHRNWNKFCNEGTKPAATLCPYTCNTCP